MSSTRSGENSSVEQSELSVKGIDYSAVSSNKLSIVIESGSKPCFDIECSRRGRTSTDQTETTYRCYHSGVPGASGLLAVRVRGTYTQRSTLTRYRPPSSSPAAMPGPAVYVGVVIGVASIAAVGALFYQVR